MPTPAPTDVASVITRRPAVTSTLAAPSPVIVVVASRVTLPAPALISVTAIPAADVKVTSSLLVVTDVAVMAPAAVSILTEPSTDTVFKATAFSCKM